MKYERLNQNISILNMHNHSFRSVKQLTDGKKTENQVIDEIVHDTIEILDKIEQGTLIELPCKVGDRVYVIADGIWHCQQVWQFRYDSCGLFVKTVGNYPYDFEWGETAFLTREEAEKRLKELQECIKR